MLPPIAPNFSEELVHTHDFCEFGDGKDCHFPKLNFGESKNQSSKYSPLLPFKALFFQRLPVYDEPATRTSDTEMVCKRRLRPEKCKWNSDIEWFCKSYDITA